MSGRVDPISPWRVVHCGTGDELAACGDRLEAQTIERRLADEGIRARAERRDATDSVKSHPQDEPTEFAQTTAREAVIRAVLSVLSAERPEFEHAHTDDDRWYSDLRLVWAARRLAAVSRDVEAEPVPTHADAQIAEGEQAGEQS